VGPTTDLSVEARPTTDDVLDFEDLIVFSIEFQALSAPIAGAVPARSEFSVDRLLLGAPARVTAGDELQVPITLQGAGALQGVSVRLAWDPAVVRPVGILTGGALARVGGIALEPRPGGFDAALLGKRETGWTGEMVLGSVRFEALAAGDPKIRIESADGRDAANHKLPLATAAPEEKKAPRVSFLAPVAPNPVRGAAVVAFGLARRGPVELAIYSVDGRRVRSLLHEDRDAGEYRIEWDGRDQGGRRVAAGVYYLRLVAGPTRVTRSLVYLR
jgi:hypothetical protein